MKHLSIDIETFSDVDIKNLVCLNIVNLQSLSYCYLPTHTTSEMSMLWIWHKERKSQTLLYPI